jgi:hypothetical protein
MILSEDIKLLQALPQDMDVFANRGNGIPNPDWSRDFFRRIINSYGRNANARRNLKNLELIEGQKS